MAPDAGFAVAIGIRESQFQNKIRVSYHSGDIRHWLPTIPVSFQGVELVLGDQAGDQGQGLFLDIPEIQLRGAYPDSFIINLYARGPLLVMMGNYGEKRDVEMRVVAQVPHKVSVQGDILALGVAGEKASLKSLQIEPFAGSRPFSDPIKAVLVSPEFKDAAEPIIQGLLSSLAFMSPFSLSDTLSLPYMDVMCQLIVGATAKTLNGVLVVGLDASLRFGSCELFSTCGDPDQFFDITYGQMDVGVWENPTVAKTLMECITRSQTATKLQSAGAGLGRLSATLNEGYLYITGTITKSVAEANFKIWVVPRLERKSLQFIMDCEVDVDAPWWYDALAILGGVLTFGLAYVYMKSLLASMRSRVYGGIGSAFQGGLSQGVPVMDSYIKDDAIVRWRLKWFEVHQAGIYAGMTENYEFPSERVYVPDGIPIEEIARSSVSCIVVRLPYDVQPDDPDLRIDWTVRRGDTNGIVLQVGGKYQDTREISLSGLQAVLYVASCLKVECWLYRTLGEKNIDLFNSCLSFRVGDRLDRSHPFVRWRHNVLLSNVRIERDGSTTLLGRFVEYRHSRIHRTDFPQRCKMASKYSIRGPELRGTGLREKGKNELEYLDALPFPRTELKRNRHLLCDYCFFGGPDKTRPLPLPH